MSCSIGCSSLKQGSKMGAANSRVAQLRHILRVPIEQEIIFLRSSGVFNRFDRCLEGFSDQLRATEAQ